MMMHLRPWFLVLLVTPFVLLLLAKPSLRALRGVDVVEEATHGRLLANPPYYSVSVSGGGLAPPSNLAALGNPLKGLMGGARWRNPNDWPAQPEPSLEWYNIGMDEVLVGNMTLNWQTFEAMLNACAERSRHAVFSFFIHWPGDPLRLPLDLLDQVKLVSIKDGVSPDYGDPILLANIDYFLAELAAKYDGDKRIGYIQQGILGFWGEWHVYPEDQNIIPESTKNTVNNWFKDRFAKTQIQARYPRSASLLGNTVDLGLFDGSFTFNTLDGTANGGWTYSWYFWPKVVTAGQTDFWKTHAMGGETRPENQATVFEAGYPGGTFEKQRFGECVDVTHATYMLHHNAYYTFQYTGSELAHANNEHAHMGYNFYVSQVRVSSSQTYDLLDVEVTIVQSGVAPFYYDLSLALLCNGYSATKPGVEAVRFYGEQGVFLFTEIPSTASCRNAVTLALVSSYGQGRPFKFAQGDGTVTISVPPFAPVLPPLATPAALPVETPVDTPAASPAEQPVAAPATEPAAIPVEPPVEAPAALPAEPPVTAPAAILVDPPVATPVEPLVTTPAALPVQPPVAAPVFLPVVATPVTIQVELPVATPMAPPVELPPANPVALPVAPQVEPPVPWPAAPPVMPPVRFPLATPVAPPLPPPVAQPVVPPVAPPVTNPIAPPISRPVSRPVASPVVPPVAPPITVTKGITGMALVDTDQPSTKIPLTNGAVISVASIGGGPFNIDVQTAGTIGSIVFAYNGKNVRNENTAPYSFCGDTVTKYSACPQFVAGTTHKVTATAYPKTSGRGIAFSTMTVTFSLVK